jgi:hypothetical protein
MTLNEFRELIFKKRKGVIIAGVVMVLVIGAVVLTERPGQEQKPPEDASQEVQYPEGSQPSPAGTDVSGVKILTAVIPEELNTYKLVSSQTSFSESEVVGFAKALGFGETWMSKDSAGGNDSYVFTKGEKFLTVDTSPPSLFFSTGSLFPKGKVPSEERAVTAGESLLSKIGLEDLIPLPGSYRLLAADQNHFFSTVSSTAANLVSVTFTPEKNSVPIRGDTSAELSATIFLDTTKTIVSLRYYKTNLQFELTGTAKIKPLDTALTESQNGKGTVVSAEPFEELDIDANPNVLSSFSPSSAYLAYYLSEDGSLTPIYVFEGTGVMESGEGKVIATVYLSAGNP